MVFAVEKHDPLHLFSKVLEDSILFLREDPHGLVHMATAEGQLRQHVPFLHKVLSRAAVIDYI